MRPPLQILLAIAAIFVAVVLVPALVPVLLPALFPGDREPPAIAAPEAAKELVVLIHPGPVVYFPGPDGAAVGLDVDLLRRFAAERRLPVRFVPEDSTARLLAEIARGRAHVGAGTLLLPLRDAATIGAVRPPAASAGTIAEVPSGPTPLWTRGYVAVEPVLICNTDSYRPARWNDLEGETVAYLRGTGLDAEVAALAAAYPGVRFDGHEASSPAALLAAVSDGEIGYALVSSLAAAVARNIYLDYEVAFAAGPKREVAWAVPARFPGLRDELDRFLERARRDGTLARLAERYLPDTRAVGRVDAGALRESIRTVLPQWKAAFRDAQEHTDVEWRLLAAIAYQESKWDPYATSETGVRGLMQLTEDTARHLGIADRLDPRESVLGAARYLRDLKAKLPERIQEPDRTWLALAAFNIGLGHLEDARVLAQKQKLNPDLWSDVKKALPLLALPEYHADAKNGYARGGMPVAFVDRVRAYYDILLAHESPLQPRLRRATEALPPEPPPLPAPPEATRPSAPLEAAGR